MAYANKCCHEKHNYVNKIDEQVKDMKVNIKKEEESRRAE